MPRIGKSHLIVTGILKLACINVLVALILARAALAQSDVEQATRADADIVATYPAKFPPYCYDPLATEVMDIVRPQGNTRSRSSGFVCEAEFLVWCGGGNCSAPWNEMGYAMYRPDFSPGCSPYTTECLYDLYVQLMHRCVFCTNLLQPGGNCQPFLLTCRYEPIGL